MTPQHFDIAIIGTGSGNSLPGPEFEDQSIAIIEKGTFGGTCLNVGCIPTKMFVRAADLIEEINHADRLGVSAQVNGVDLAQIQNRVFTQRIDQIAAGGEAYRRGPETPNITVFDGAAKFVGPKLIQTADGDTPKLISADTIVIAAGARPQIPEQIQTSGISFETNETIMRLEQLPKTLTVLGGGYIAVEFAHVFAAFGVKVTLINRSNQLLRKLDETLATAFTEQFATHSNIELKLGRQITAATESASGAHTLTLDNGETVTGEKLLVATGRIPNGDLLDLEQTGVEAKNGRIIVDEYGRTNVPGIWALGDVSSPFQLKHVANSELRTIRHNLLHPDDLQPLQHDAVPAAVFTYPQLATVGLTEAEARSQGFDLTIKLQKYGDVAYGWALEDQTSFVKLIADRQSGQLLGAHLLGPEASTLIQPLIMMMALKLDLRGLTRAQYWIHPALTEVVENALLGLEFAPQQA